MYARDRELMKDFRSASHEFERRLTASLRMKDGLLLVRDSDPILGRIALYVLPPTTQWTISCGMGGLFIWFGNSVSGDEVEIQLASADLDPGECEEVAPQLGKKIVDLVGHRNDIPMGDNTPFPPPFPKP
jgi:hypothetical protein